jgi:hypothetical protein
MSASCKDRTASAEEWRALVAAAPPRIAGYLEAGASFVGRDGVRTHPPHGYVVRDTLAYKTTITSAPSRSEAPSRASN